MRHAIEPPALWAHRGLGGTALENTLVAFTRALGVRANAIELDVRPCRSGEMVVFHDADLMRLLGRPERVEALDLATLRALRWCDGQARIPTLSEAIALVCGGGARLNVELKGDVDDLPAATRRLHEELSAQSHEVRGRILVSSFSHGALEAMHQMGPHALALLLRRSAPDPERVPSWAVAVHPHAGLCTRTRVATWQRHGLAVNVWTVNDSELARRLHTMGVDALITDDVPGVRVALA